MKQLIISITESYYKKAIEYRLDAPTMIVEAIRHGTPLPKGHGRIIDESQVTGTFIWDNGYIECYAPTIIEADKESE